VPRHRSPYGSRAGPKIPREIIERLNTGGRRCTLNRAALSRGGGREGRGEKISQRGSVGACWRPAGGGVLGARGGCGLSRARAGPPLHRQNGGSRDRPVKRGEEGLSQNARLLTKGLAGPGAAFLVPGYFEADPPKPCGPRGVPRTKRGERGAATPLVTHYAPSTTGLSRCFGGGGRGRAPPPPARVDFLTGGEGLRAPLRRHAGSYTLGGSGMTRDRAQARPSR